MQHMSKYEKEVKQWALRSGKEAANRAGMRAEVREGVARQ